MACAIADTIDIDSNIIHRGWQVKDNPNDRAEVDAKPDLRHQVDDAPKASNRHPAVMFEIIAQDQARAKAFYAAVFGWNYDIGSSGFAYVHFAAEARPLLGGIGQANPDIPGFEPGHNFYLVVEDLAATIDKAVAAGGARFVEPTPVDGYRFAMIRDPEGNPIGLIEPFSQIERMPEAKA